ncbi:MAG TPA: NrfD/PsrC family molybdoenzyme membrane anchor subunit [Thermoanaerobaculia bacterium]|nr:NrfD/PsrC family molybdoenzyme membrane anchor subunit [Thermoanaerobaculia bacterium]
MATLDLEGRQPVYVPPPVVLAPGHTPETVTRKISSIIIAKAPRWWYVAFGISFCFLMMFLTAVTWLFVRGVGIWGINIPAGWGFAIVNFVWWIGIGHAGTLISAILLLLRQDWRTSINRFAEAMTLCAVACAGLFPVLHLGRPWLAYWLIPYPNTMGLWPQFRSPLIWDVFAVSTYATVSLIFWYVGMVPDLGTMRDRAPGKVSRIVFGVLSLGWRGSTRHWHNYESAYLLLAGLATPLVLSVHTVVSFDFAIGIVPGWHSTIFPPYFVAGAIFDGFAMVLTLVLPLRAAFGLHDFITARHLHAMGKVMLATGLVVFYGYLIEIFFAWYSANHDEWFMMKNRMTGPYWFVWAALILCNGLIPQLLWSWKVRSSPLALFLISMSINIGMWLERFVIVIVSLTRDFLPSSWAPYRGTIWDWMTYLGTVGGVFLCLMFLFVRFLPMISMSEMRTLTPGSGSHGAQEAAS